MDLKNLKVTQSKLGYFSTNNVQHLPEVNVLNLSDELIQRINARTLQVGSLVFQLPVGASMVDSNCNGLNNGKSFTFDLYNLNDYMDILHDEKKDILDPILTSKGLVSIGNPESHFKMVRDLYFLIKLIPDAFKNIKYDNVNDIENFVDDNNSKYTDFLIGILKFVNRNIGNLFYINKFKINNKTEKEFEYNDMVAGIFRGLCLLKRTLCKHTAFRIPFSVKSTLSFNGVISSGIQLMDNPTSDEFFMNKKKKCFQSMNTMKFNNVILPCGIRAIGQKYSIYMVMIDDVPKFVLWPTLPPIRLIQKEKKKKNMTDFINHFYNQMTRLFVYVNKDCKNIKDKILKSTEGNEFDLFTKEYTKKNRYFAAVDGSVEIDKGSIDYIQLNCKMILLNSINLLYKNVITLHGKHATSTSIDTYFKYYKAKSLDDKQKNYISYNRYVKEMKRYENHMTCEISSYYQNYNDKDEIVYRLFMSSLFQFEYGTYVDDLGDLKNIFYF